MPNTKSAKKDLRRSTKRRIQNQSVKSALKTYVKKTRTAVAQGDGENAAEALRLASKMLDKAVQNGVIHKNQGARRKARIAKALASLQKAGAEA
jgi:small subunit ribosomal protein S20